MEVKIESKGDFDDVTRWLDDISKRRPSKALSDIASDGTKSLANHTPRDTGATAEGWQAKITTKGTTSEIAWINTAHPETSANIALLIEQGHGTRTGGYVPPNPYIKESMKSVWSDAGDKIAKELIK